MKRVDNFLLGIFAYFVGPYKCIGGLDNVSKVKGNRKLDAACQRAEFYATLLSVFVKAAFTGAWLHFWLQSPI